MLENSTDYFSVIISTCYKWAPVTTAWSVFRLRTDETASLYKVNLRIYWISQSGRPSRKVPPVCELGEGLILVTVYTSLVTKFSKIL